ncbi:MAG: hypothetical protein EON87_21450 [Brevundimonas sp.]|nr:MAG: hypothetical protein EON87_21450 [Brevundimonas sp.]
MTTRTLEQINDRLEQAHHLLSGRDAHDSRNWLLIASNIARADQDLRALQRTNPTLEAPLLGEVLTLLRQPPLPRRTSRNS